MFKDDILYIIPITKKVSKDFYNIIGNYENVLLLDNNFIDKKILPISKNKFTIMKFSEEWGMCVLNSKYKKYAFINQNSICKDNVNKNDVYDRVITWITNYTLKRRFKHVFNRLLVFSRDSIKNFNNIPLNGFKSNIEIIEYALNNNIYYEESDQVINTGFRNKINSIKILFPLIIKNIIPYIISIVFFLVLFYVIKMNNELEHLLVSNVFGEVVGAGLYIAFNYIPYFKYNYIRDNVIDILIKLVKICISGYIIYLLYKIIGINIVISKLISDLLLLIGVEMIRTKIPTSI